MPLVARLAEVSDTYVADEICKIVVKQHGHTALCLETALLSICAYDTDTDRLVGYLCLDDTPCIRLGQKPSASAHEWFKANAKLKLGSEAFVRIVASLPEYEMESIAAMLRVAFASMHSLDRVLLGTGEEIKFTEPGMSGCFSKLLSAPEHNVRIYQCLRADVVEPLVIRPAVVEDHDDMLPLMERTQQRMPALAQLPASSRPDEPFALTRVVSSQDASNIVVVARVARKMVGFAVFSADVDPSNLAEVFDLHPYDNFITPNEYEQRYDSAAAAIRTKKLALLREQRQEQKEQDANDAALQHAVQEASQLDGAAGSIEDSGSKADPAAAEDEDARAIREEQEEAELQAAADPTAVEVRLALIEMYGDKRPKRGTTLFALSMLCMDEAYEGQAHEFLATAFAAMPARDYCVVMLPHSSVESPLLHAFTRVPPLPGTTFPEVLYVHNRNALLSDFHVVKGSDAELAGVHALVRGMPNAVDMMESYTTAMADGTAVVAVCEGEVVGVCTINPAVDLELLQANFKLSQHVDLQLHADEQHGEIDMYCMNPIFAHRHRDFLTSVQRLAGKTVLYYALPPSTQPPDMAEVLTQAAPRYRVSEEHKVEFAIYLFARRTAFQRRTPVNARVLVVGASECGLAVLEHLMLHAELQFNHLTLLAPGGIKVGGVASQYTASVIAKLALEARVCLLDADLSAIDREACSVEISDGTILTYEHLVLATGLQDQSRYQFAEAQPNTAGLLVTDMDVAADFTMAMATAMEGILVYGNSLGAYNALATLETKAAGNKTEFVAPLGQEHALVNLLKEAAKIAKVSLPEPLPARVSALVPAQLGDETSGLDLAASSVQAIASFKYLDADGKVQADDDDAEDDSERPRQLLVDLVVGCIPHSFNRGLFECFNNAGLVFDGRLVVDGSFTTNDRKIMAAGPATKLSRRYGSGGLLMEHFDSREQGHGLAANLAQRLQASFGQGQGPAPAAQEQDPPPAPQLTRAKVVGCMVPGSYTLLYAATHAAMRAPSLSAPPGGQVIHTSTRYGLAAMTISAEGFVQSALYFGRNPPSVHRLTALVGLASTYMGDLVPRFHAGKVPDLLAELAAPWAEVLMHEDFRDLREELLAEAEAIALGQSPQDATQLVTNVQDVVMEFVRMRETELKGFHVPVSTLG